ncbi:uncharacterized protein LOC128013537 isoform X1 [Carassius gibelio]|uniref:uncharacterized protein LOC128013537 isoform X1 n=1 Tax=Carassius gibelio TaxID=101364 RepID=UPI0022776929|nr:uncharacterized protein LOC128013537 isoform X1 [Carassius gibelio]
MSAHGSSLCPSDGHISLSDRQCRSARLIDMRSLLLISVLLALIRGGEGQKLTVILRPKFPQVYAGDDITLICNREGGSKPTTWYFNGAPQTHKDYLMLLTAVTPDNNGEYKCDQGGTKSDPLTLTVLDLEPHAQLSPSVGGAVMTKGDGRNLVLQTDDDDLENWNCFVLRGVSTSAIGLDVNKEMKRAVIFADLKEAERATFWCKKKKAVLRSNAVTLKKTELMVMLVPPAVPALKGEPVTLRCEVWGKPKLDKTVFYKNKTQIKSSAEGTYTITSATQSDNGMYSCHATYRFTHISTGAAKKDGDSDAQELKVIGGPPAAVISASANNLKCSCPDCPASCTSYHWYHTPFNDPFTREKRSENDESITIEKEGEYRCRRDCGNGFSRFSHVYSYTVTANMVPILMAALVIFIGLLIILLIALKRRRGGSAIQETKQDKNKTTTGDYEQIQLKDKAVYHTLGEGTSKDQAEGGYEPLQKTQEEGVYHTVGAVGPVEGQSEGQAQGGYEALKSIKVDVYHTVGPVEGQSEGQGQGQGQGGYEALKSVKAEVYQTLSSDDSKKPAGEAEGGYEQLPQKDKDYETVAVEDNPYEEVKKQMGKENE